MSKSSQLRQRAQNYVKKGRLDSAIEEYRKLIQVESRNPNLYNELGDLHLKAGDRVQAVSSFEKASVLYEKVALYNNAIAVCKKILRVVPNRLDTIFKLGELKAKQKFIGEAEAYFSQYLEATAADPAGNVEGVQAKIALMLEFVPDRDEIVTAAAELYKRLGFKVKAAELLGDLAARSEKRGDTEAARRYRVQIDTMKSSFSSEELSELGTQLASSATREGIPGDTAAVPAAAADEAARACSRPSPTVAAEGARPPIMSDRGHGVSDDRPQATESARARTQEVLVDEEPPGDHAAEPDIVEEAAERERSVEEMEEPLDERAAEQKTIEPPDARGAEPAFGARRSDGEEAKSFAREITSDVEEDDYRSHYDLGMAYIEMALYDESIKELQIASRSEQLHLRSIEMIGHCFLMQNKPRLAVKQLERVLAKAREAGVEHLGINYNLGLAYEMLDDHEKAREHFEEVYIVDVTFRDIAEKMARYGALS